MKHVASMILDRKPQIVGIYQLTMKMGSDNFRQSSIQSVIDYLSEAGLDIVIYEPTANAEKFNGYKVVKDLEIFKQTSDVVVANRLTSEIEDIASKVYSRDLFSRD